MATCMLLRLLGLDCRYINCNNIRLYKYRCSTHTVCHNGETNCRLSLFVLSSLKHGILIQICQFSVFFPMLYQYRCVSVHRFLHFQDISVAKTLKVNLISLMIAIFSALSKYLVHVVRFCRINFSFVSSPTVRNTVYR